MFTFMTISNKSVTLEVVSPQQPGGYVKQTLPHTKYIIYMVETTETSSTVLE